jgi:hypothetical protein
MGENIDRLVMDSQSLVDDYADLAVHLFAKYDPPLLMEFLKSSTSYAFEKVCRLAFTIASLTIPGRARVRDSQILRRAGISVLEDRTDEASTLSYH